MRSLISKEIENLSVDLFQAKGICSFVSDNYMQKAKIKSNQTIRRSNTQEQAEQRHGMNTWICSVRCREKETG